MEANLTNNQLKKLLEEYNIYNQDIKGSGKNGNILKSDRIKMYNKLKVLPSLPPEVVSLITNQLALPTTRLINKQSLKDTKELYIQNMRQRIYHFITDHFSLNTINGMLEEREIEEITSKQEFKDMQWEKIITLSMEEMIFYHMLIKMITKQQISTVDDIVYIWHDFSRFFLYKMALYFLNKLI